MKPHMNILIVGGNGFIGRHIAATCAAAGHTAILGVRNPDQHRSNVECNMKTDTDAAIWLRRFSQLNQHKQIDAVINTGRSLVSVLDGIAEKAPAHLLAVTLVGYRSTVEGLAAERPSVDFIAARLSERSYVGKGGTDTGARLFGTTKWASELAAGAK